MSINLGPVAFEAVQNLKNNSDWRKIVIALEEQMSALMNRAIEGPPADRTDGTAYARALRDLVAHIDQVETGVRQVIRPTVKAKTNG